MPAPSAPELLDTGNRLWFEEGRTNKAMEAYRQAAATAPSDPVILYRLALSLWAVDELAESRIRIEAAAARSSELSQYGVRAVQEARNTLSAPPPALRSRVQSPRQLDMDELQKMTLSPHEWRMVSSDAQRRGIDGVATLALEYSGGPFQDTDLARDVMELEFEASRNRSLLDSMRKGQDTPGSSAELPKAASVLYLARESGPIVDVRIEPARSRIDSDVMLRVSVVNSSPKQMVLNRRLLLNRPNAPPSLGEIFYEIDGPSGYENLIEFDRRAGAPAPHDFVLVQAGQGVSRTFTLTTFESLHRSGTYVIRLTYRNVVAMQSAGVSAWVGTASAPPVTFYRIG